MARFKFVYIGVIVLSIAGFLFLLHFKEWVIYSLYGYDAGLFRGSSPEAYEAFNRTLPARKFCYYVALGSTFASLILSGIAVYLRVYVTYFFSHLIFVVSLVQLFLFWVASIIPRRGL